MNEICIDSPAREREIRRMASEVGSVNQQIDALLRPALARGAATLAGRLTKAGKELDSEDQTRLGAELQYALTEPSHPLYPFARSAESPAGADAPDFAAWMGQLREEMADWAAKGDRSHPIWAERGDEIYEDFEQGFGKWTSTGMAFGESPVRFAPPGQELGGHAGQAVAASFGSGAAALVGTLTTERVPHARAARPRAPSRPRVLAGAEGGRSRSLHGDRRRAQVGPRHARWQRPPEVALDRDDQGAGAGSA